MDNRPSLADLTSRAEQLDVDLDELVADVWRRGVPDCEKPCGDAQIAIRELLTILSNAAAVDPRDELPADGGITP